MPSETGRVKSERTARTGVNKGMNTGMKLGIVSTIGSQYSWAGSEEMWWGVATAALDAGYQVAIHAAAKIAASDQVSVLTARGAVAYSRPEFTALTRRLSTRKLYSRYRVFFAQRLDVICLSMGGIADCLWMPDLLEALYRANLPYLVIVQANAEGIVSKEAHREVLRKFYAQSAGVIFVSHHNHRLAERQLAMSFPNPQIMLNPLRTQVLSELKWPPESQCFRLAEVARLDVTDKHQDHLLEALSSSKWKARNWQLTFFGSGDDESHIRRLIQFYDLEDKVKIGGFVKDFREIWQDYHLHILPSRREGMPLALIESMACGRPALVTRAGGSPELVEDQINGFVCPGMHPEVLQDALEAAWERRYQWKAMGLAAAAKVQSVMPKNLPNSLLNIVRKAADTQIV